MVLINSILRKELNLVPQKLIIVKIKISEDKNLNINQKNLRKIKINRIIIIKK
jgi:hypothetical protein